MLRFSFILMGLLGSSWAAVAPPPQMETRGVPEIPDVLAKQAAPYLQVRPLRFQDWQLKGTNATVLISQRPPKGEVSQLHVLNKPKGQP